MQEWEYLEIYIAGGKWADSTGADGDLPEVQVGGHAYANTSELLDELGSVGWELVAVQPGQAAGVSKLFLKRPLDVSEEDEEIE